MWKKTHDFFASSAPWRKYPTFGYAISANICQHVARAHTLPTKLKWWAMPILQAGSGYVISSNICQHAEMMKDCNSEVLQSIVKHAGNCEALPLPVICFISAPLKVHYLWHLIDISLTPTIQGYLIMSSISFSASSQ